MEESPKTPEKKLIIDEDWKSQVEAEKEAARKAEEPAKSAETAPSSGPAAAHAARCRPPTSCSS